MLYALGAVWVTGGFLAWLAGRRIIKKNRVEKSRFLIYGCIAFTWMIIGLLIGSALFDRHQAKPRQEEQQNVPTDEKSEHRDNPDAAKKAQSPVGKTEESSMPKNKPEIQKEEKQPNTKTVTHVISPETERKYKQLVERVHEIQELINNGTVPQKSNFNTAK